MELLGAVLGGGVTGIAGTFLSGIFGFFKQRQINKQQIEMRKMDLEELRLEAESAEKRVALRIEGEVEKAETELMAESLRNEQAITEKWGGVEATPAMAWVLLFIDFIRSMMRPLITIVSIWLTYMIWKHHRDSSDIEMQIIQAVLFVMVSSSLWWFGTRAMGFGGPNTNQMTRGNGRKS